MRLIDADSLQRRICGAKCGCEYEDCGNEGDCWYDHFIFHAPTIDAVPVVRCRECIHRYTEDCPMYFHSSYWHEGYEEYVDDDTDHTEDDYFCQEGERKEGADNEP